MHRALRLAAVAGCAALLATACSGGSGSPRANSTPAAAVKTSASPSPTTAPVDPASVHANELGLVPVLMYHQLTDKPSSVYDRRPADFKAELEQLAADGYVPITADDFVQGHIDIPAGKHPVVLTFDDSTLSQFALGPDGTPKAGTAVAILQEVAKEHPGFTPTATFFVNNDPFTDADGKTALGWLHEHGFDIGDHTVDHANLREVSTAKAQQEIADNLKLITTAVPGFTPLTMALPFGAYPTDSALAHHGSADGTTYDFKGVFLVGSNPSHSPFHKDFDPFNIPRIRSQSQADASAADKNFISSYYLPWLKAHPDSWYTSDGNPRTISFPASFAGALAPAFKNQADPY